MAQTTAILSTMRTNYMHAAWQAELCHRIGSKLVQCLTTVLEKDCFPDKHFTVQVYGSLEHGLFVPGTSKINVDVSPKDNAPWPGEDIYNGMVLRVLASTLQAIAERGGVLQHPVLVWHRTVQRPWLVMFAWDGIPVHVTYRNTAGVEVSRLIDRTLRDLPYLRLTLFYWKERLRPVQGTQFIGPNGGQVSTYALFTILSAHIKELMASINFRMFELRARQVAVSHLVTPRAPNTPNVMASEHVNLTSRSFLAKDLACALAALPPITD